MQIHSSYELNEHLYIEFLLLANWRIREPKLMKDKSQIPVTHASAPTSFTLFENYAIAGASHMMSY